MVSALNRFSIVGKLSSAARMPLPGARSVATVVSIAGAAINKSSRRHLGELHHHLTDILPLEKTDERAHRLVDSFHHGIFVLQFAGSEIAAHFFFKFVLAIEPIANDQ